MIEFRNSLICGIRDFERSTTFRIGKPYLRTLHSNLVRLFRADDYEASKMNECFIVASKHAHDHVSRTADDLHKLYLEGSTHPKLPIANSFDRAGVKSFALLCSDASGMRSIFVPPDFEKEAMLVRENLAKFGHEVNLKLLDGEIYFDSYQGNLIHGESLSTCGMYVTVSPPSEDEPLDSDANEEFDANEDYEKECYCISANHCYHGNMRGNVLRCNITDSLAFHVSAAHRNLVEFDTMPVSTEFMTNGSILVTYRDSNDKMHLMMVEPGSSVVKIGAYSGFTVGKLLACADLVKVQTGGEYEHVILVDGFVDRDFAGGGDSGSIIFLHTSTFNDGAHALGMRIIPLAMISAEMVHHGRRVTICVPISDVIARLFKRPEAVFACDLTCREHSNLANSHEEDPSHCKELVSPQGVLEFGTRTLNK